MRTNSLDVDNTPKTAKLSPKKNGRMSTITGFAVVANFRLRLLHVSEYDFSQAQALPEQEATMTQFENEKKQASGEKTRK